jgi:hypothetical protein
MGIKRDSVRHEQTMLRTYMHIRNTSDDERQDTKCNGINGCELIFSSLQFEHYLQKLDVIQKFDSIEY